MDNYFCNDLCNQAFLNSSQSFQWIFDKEIPKSKMHFQLRKPFLKVAMEPLQFVGDSLRRMY